MANGYRGKVAILSFGTFPGGRIGVRSLGSLRACKFGQGESAAALMLSDPGPELFARWADEKPSEAIEWFTKESVVSDEGLF